MHAPATRAELAELLSAPGDAHAQLHENAQRTREKHVGMRVYLRGLIELSNRCERTCRYCGIGAGIRQLPRYELDTETALRLARRASTLGYGGLTLQAGEQRGAAWTDKIARLIERISSETKGQLGITLSLGVQNAETLRLWRNAGAARYLLRIETSDPAQFARLHPAEGPNGFAQRAQCLRTIRALGYQVGSGVLVGLPGQNEWDLAGDLLWLRDEDVDMVGLGPYIEQEGTSLSRERAQLRLPLWSAAKRLRVSIAMVALLRLMMPEINIAATTAMRTLSSQGRVMALRAGANVLMPNLTPSTARAQYQLYQGKGLGPKESGDSLTALKAGVTAAGCHLALWEQGTPPHYARRIEANAATSP